MASKGKGRRVTIDLTESAVRELDRLRELTGLTTADLFRNGFSLLRLYIQAKEKGQTFVVAEEDDPTAPVTKIELTFFIPQSDKDEVQGKAKA